MLFQYLRRLWQDEAGQDVTEYILLLVLILLAAITSVKGLASSIDKAFPVNGFALSIEKVYNNVASNLTNQIT